MLLNDLFFIREEGPGGRYQVGLNAGHGIFGGHFPGQPVLPGACLLELVKELTARSLGIPVRLLRADQLKFSAQVLPEGEDPLEITLSCFPLGQDTVRVSASCQYRGRTNFRFNGSFVLLR